MDHEHDDLDAKEIEEENDEKLGDEDERNAHNLKNNCRMYEQPFPEVDDFVMVLVKSVAEMGAYVSLLEYNSIEGMILMSELSRRRIRSVNRLVRVGRREVVVVLRVDKEKGYIDLSKRRVTPEDIQKCEEKYNKSKAVHSIMRHVSETAKVRLEDLYKQFGWPLYRKYGHAYDAFRLIGSCDDPEQVLQEFDVPENIKKILVRNIKVHLTPQPVKIRADLELTCFNYEGIDAIKHALRAGESLSTKECLIKIKLVAPPLYVMMTTSLDKELGVKLLEDACKEIEDTITSKGGDLTIKVAPRAVSERDDTLLKRFMETMEKQNAEISGDDPEDDM